MRLVSVGPNLPSPLCDLGTIHFHAEGCAHLKRGDLGRVHRMECHVTGAQPEELAVEYATIKEAVLDMYPPDNFLYDPDTDEYDAYRNDLYFAPCVKLPES